MQICSKFVQLQDSKCPVERELFYIQYGGESTLEKLFLSDLTGLRCAKQVQDIRAFA